VAGKKKKEIEEICTLKNRVELNFMNMLMGLNCLLLELHLNNWRKKNGQQL